MKHKRTGFFDSFDWNEEIILFVKRRNNIVCFFNKKGKPKETMQLQATREETTRRELKRRVIKRRIDEKETAMQKRNECTVFPYISLRKTAVRTYFCKCFFRDRYISRLYIIIYIYIYNVYSFSYTYIKSTAIRYNTFFRYIVSSVPHFLIRRETFFFVTKQILSGTAFSFMSIPSCILTFFALFSIPFRVSSDWPMFVLYTPDSRRIIINWYQISSQNTRIPLIQLCSATETTHLPLSRSNKTGTRSDNRDNRMSIRWSIIKLTPCVF